MQWINKLLVLALVGAFFVGTANAATPSNESDEVRKARLDAQYVSANEVLNDDSFWTAWGKEGSIADKKTAKQVLKLADSELERLKSAVGDVREACLDRFFVNRCMDEARRKSFVREREIRRVMVLAQDVLHEYRTREIEAKKLKETQSSAPSRVIAPKVPKEKREPMKLKSPRKANDDLSDRALPGATAPKDSSTPMDMSEFERRREAVSRQQEKALMRQAQESANEESYNDKQQKARIRFEQAEETAKKRSAERAARQKKFEQNREERREAQKRYEAKEQEKEHGVLGWFN